MSSTVAILNDTTLCVGCERCVEACREENKLGPDYPWRWKQAIDDLSASRYTTIVRPQNDKFVRRLCRHCLEPACVSACIVGALQKTGQGPVIYDLDKCIGCRYCMMACPYGIPRYEWDKPTPLVRKCTFCYPRLQKGKPPACVEACPYEATVFGTREEMLREAYRRLEKQPDKYIGKVFGEEEVGGTSVLYLSDIDLDFLSFRPDLGEQPLPQLTWAALSKVPPLVAGVGGAMIGVWWIINRRMRLAEEGENSHREGNKSDSA